MNIDILDSEHVDVAVVDGDVKVDAFEGSIELKLDLVAVLHRLAKKTDNSIDDAAVRLIAAGLGKELPADPAPEQPEQPAPAE